MVYRMFVLVDAVELDPTLDFAAGTIAGTSNVAAVSEFVALGLGRDINDLWLSWCCSGMAALVVGYPFDTGALYLRLFCVDCPLRWRVVFERTVKVRFQNPATQSKYRSTFHAITTIVREERFLGLYKGISSPLVCPQSLPKPVLAYLIIPLCGTHDRPVYVVVLLYRPRVRS